MSQGIMLELALKPLWLIPRMQRVLANGLWRQTEDDVGQSSNTSQLCPQLLSLSNHKTDTINTKWYCKQIANMIDNWSKSGEWGNSVFQKWRPGRSLVNWEILRCTKKSIASFVVQQLQHTHYRYYQCLLRRERKTVWERKSNWVLLNNFERQTCLHRACTLLVAHLSVMSFIHDVSWSF